MTNKSNLSGKYPYTSEKIFGKITFFSTNLRNFIIRKFTLYYVILRHMITSNNLKLYAALKKQNYLKKFF